MPRVTRLSLAALLFLAACGPDGSAPVSDPTGLTVAAMPVCTGQTKTLIVKMFPSHLRSAALDTCAEIQARGSRGPGQMQMALDLARKFLDKTLMYADAGRLTTPEGLSLEEALAKFASLLYSDAGFDVAAGDVGIGQLDGTGGEVVIPSMHAAVAFGPGDLSGETWITIVQLPLPSTVGQCPFPFSVDHDCYPLFYDITVSPAGNQVNPATLGLCVLDTGPFAPPNMTVADRLRIASEDHSNPGTLEFWPSATAPSSVDCSDLAFQPSGWQADLVEMLGPFPRIFSVTPAYANPGRLGASVSSFSPFAAADTLPKAPPAPSLILPASGAVIPQNNHDTAASAGACTFANGTWGFMIGFDWASVAGADSYDLQLQHMSAGVPALDVNTPVSAYMHIECTGFVEDEDLTGWEWRVRSVDPGPNPGPWSADRPIEFSSVNVDTLGSISGFVRDSAGVPIEDAVVTVLATAVDDTTGATGAYSAAPVLIPCCTPFADGGTISRIVEVTADDYVSQQDTLEFTTGRPDVVKDWALEEEVFVVD